MSTGKRIRAPMSSAAGYKSARMVGGRLLKYTMQDPVAGSSRWRAASRTYGRSSGEIKGVDTLLTLSPVISTTGTNASAFTLNLIAPGTASFNRVGRKIKLSTLRLKGTISFNYTPSATGVVVGNSLRMVIVWDKQTNGSLPVWSDIFGYTLQDGTEASTVMSQPRYDNMARFQVIKDVVIEPQTLVGTTASTGVCEQMASFDYFLALKGKETTYGGQSATCTVADIATGGLYVFFRAQNNTANNLVSVDADTVARLRYID